MMVDAMKWIALLLCSFPALAGLADVKAVYLLPMARGMDQYLANQLVKAGFYRVVTDPLRADAVFTDRVGETLESQLKELFDPPKPVDQKKKEGSKEPGAGPGSGSAPGEVSGYSGAAPRSTAFSSSKGNLFLVDVKSRTVLWSIHARPKHTTPAQLDHTARQIVESLNEALHPKPKK
jgi:hypothetical protein